jgi:hypothetical protein
MTASKEESRSFLMKTAKAPDEFLLMILLAGLLLVSGTYELFLYPRDVQYRCATQGILIMMFSYRLIVGDTVLGSYGRSWPLASLGALGLIVAAFDLLLPGMLSHVASVVSAVIMMNHAIIGMVAAFRRGPQSLVHRVLGFVFAGTLLLLALVTFRVITLPSPHWAALLFVTMGVLLMVLAFLRKDFAQHRPDELPALPFLMIVTGLILFALVVSVVLTRGEAPYSMNGGTGVFMLATAFKMMSAGETPAGTVRRTRLIVALGVLLAILTMASTVLPWTVLQNLMNDLIGIMNIIGGTLLLVGIARGRQPVRRLWLRFGATACAMIMFGFNRMWPGLFPGGVQLVTLVLFAATMTSLGVTIFLMTMAGIKAAKAAKSQAAVA